MATLKLIPIKDHPQVTTIDKFQGKEAKMVILDWVIDHHHNSGVGFNVQE